MRTLLTVLALLAVASCAQAQAGRARYADETIGPVYEMLENGAGSDEMAVNKTLGTPEHFQFQVPAGRSLRLERVNLTILDDLITPTKFAGLTAITNGVLFQVVADDSTTVLYEFTADRPITANYQWALLAGSDSLIDTASGNDQIAIRWTISKAGEQVKLRAGQYFRVVIQDNLSSMVSFLAMLQGVYEW